MTNNRISIRTSNSPLGGGSVRVYVGDDLVWQKRCNTLLDLLRCEGQVKVLVTNKQAFINMVPKGPRLVMEPKLRLV